MALEPQVIEVPPAGGVAEDGGKFVPTNGFHAADNGVFLRTGELGKRRGYSGLGTGVVGVGTLPAPDRVTTREGELLAVATASDGPTLYSYSPSGSPNWVSRGAVSGVSVARRRVLARPANDGVELAPQVARIGAWEACLVLAGGVASVRILDTKTGATRDLRLVTNQPKAVLLAGSTTFRVVYVQGLNVLSQAIDPVTATAGPLILVTSMADLPRYWDAVSTTGDAWVFASVRAAGDAVSLVRVVGSLTSTLTSITTSSAHLCGLAHRLDTLLVTWDSLRAGSLTTSGIHARTYYEPTLTSGLAPWLVRDDTSYLNLFALGCAIAADGTFLIASTTNVTAALVTTPFCSWFDAFDVAGVSLGAPQPRVWYVALGSRPFALGSDLYVVVHGDPNPAGGDLTRSFGYALLNLTRRRASWHPSDAPILVEGVLAPQDGRGLPITTSGVSCGLHLTLPVGGVVPIVVYRGDGGLVGGASAVADAVELTTSARAEPLGSTAEAGGLLLQGGAWPSLYDGLGCVEMAFLQPPEIAATSSAFDATFGPVPAPGNGNEYTYIAIYQWRDARGNVHRSRPSSAVSVFLIGTGTGAEAHCRVTLTLRTTALTRRHDPALNPSARVQIVVYRTKANAPDSHYEVTSAVWSNVAYNDPAVPAVQVVDLLSDAQMLSVPAPQLYTDGGVLENEMPPPARHLSVHGGRAWLVSAEAREVWFSRPLLQGEAPCWSTACRVTLDEAVDRVVATAGQDGTVLLLTDSQVYQVTGDGPNDTGLPPYLPPARLQVSRGCLDARTVVSWRGGTAWLASEGFVALSRRLELVQIGRPVERTVERIFALGSILGGLYDQARDRIVWTCDEDTTGRALVYDCALDAWTTWTLPGGVATSQAIWQGHHAVAYTGRVCLDMAALDPGVDWVTSVIESPWLRVGALGGYQRVWRLYLHLELLSSCALTLEIFVDGDDVTPAQTEQWTSAQLAALPGWPRAPLVVGIAPQKCTALKFRLTDAAGDTVPGDGAGFVYHGAALQLGVKRGLWKGAKENVR